MLFAQAPRAPANSPQSPGPRASRFSPTRNTWLGGRPISGARAFLPSVGSGAIAPPVNRPPWPLASARATRTRRWRPAAAVPMRASTPLLRLRPRAPPDRRPAGRSRIRLRLGSSRRPSIGRRPPRHRRGGLASLRAGSTSTPPGSPPRRHPRPAIPSALADVPRQARGQMRHQAAVGVDAFLDVRQVAALDDAVEPLGAADEHPGLAARERIGDQFP